MKRIRLKYSNHEYVVIGKDGRVHAWSETEEEAFHDLWPCEQIFPGCQVAKVVIDESVSEYPSVSTLYKIE